MRGHQIAAVHVKHGDHFVWRIFVKPTRHRRAIGNQFEAYAGIERFAIFVYRSLPRTDECLHFVVSGTLLGFGHLLGRE